jgi:effector-binding domain-containing protein
MSYQVRVEKFPGQRLAVARRRVTKPQLSKVVPEACGTVWSALRAVQIRGGRHVAVYLDDVINVEIGVELDVPFSGAGEVIPSSLPAGDVATTTHFGPYPGLGAAHEAIHRWCEANDREPIRPCWETYGHWVDEWNKDPSKIRTDVYYLLKPKS